MEDLVVIGGKPSHHTASPNRFTPEQIRLVEELWAQRRPVSEVAASLGVTVGSFYESRTYGQLRHLERRQGQGSGTRYLCPPTPKEIRQRCEEIQSRWSDVERMERRCAVSEDGLPTRNAGIKVVPSRPFSHY
jgi:hypothetical protein